MEAIIEDVAAVMSVLNNYGAGELVNANRVFEALESCNVEEGRVNQVSSTLLHELGIRTRESNSPDVVILPSENIEEGHSDIQYVPINQHVPVTPAMGQHAPMPSMNLEPTSDTHEQLVSPSLVNEFQSEFLPVKNEISTISSEVAAACDESFPVDSNMSTCSNANANAIAENTWEIADFPSTSSVSVNEQKSAIPSTSNITVNDQRSTGAIPKSSVTWSAIRQPAKYDSGDSSPEATWSIAKKKESPPKRNGTAVFSQCKKPKMGVEELSLDATGAGSSRSKFFTALRDVFPEADPIYLSKKCENIQSEVELSDEIVQMLSCDDYPRIGSWNAHEDTASASSHALGKDTPLPSTSTNSSAGSSNNVEPSTSASSSTSVSKSLKIEKCEDGIKDDTKSPHTVAKSNGKSEGSLLKVQTLNELKKRLNPESECEAGPSGLEPPAHPKEPWHDKLENFLQILPEADPTYLEEKARALYNNDEESYQFVLDALEKKEFPTRKDWQWRQDQLALQKKYKEEFSVKEFLDIFPDPHKFFEEGKRQCDKSLGAMFLRSKYRKLKVADIAQVFSDHKFNLTSTCRYLDRWRGPFMKSRRCQIEYDVKKEGNKAVDLQFLQEVAFIENEQKIVDYLNEIKQKREATFQKAKENGDLLECQCCYDGEVLLEDIRTCEEGHLFCVECVRRSSEQLIGEGKTKFPCLSDCSAEFKLKTIQEVLKPVAFSRLVQRIQVEEVKAAGIDGLVQCPFCDFCSLLPPEDKVFKCLNTNCLKRSCRDCKEEDHVPLRCEEVEKNSEVKMRTYIEDQMTAALVRTCWKCSRKFVKEDGCNKMTCQCGALMCYVCRQPVKDYSHFNGQGGDAHDKCPLYSDHRALEAEEVKKMAEKAKREALAMKPNVQLKHDPTTLLPVYKPKANQQYHDFESEDSEEGDSFGEEEEIDFGGFFDQYRRRRYFDEEMEEEEEVEEEEDEEMEEEEEEEDDDDDTEMGSHSTNK